MPVKPVLLAHQSRSRSLVDYFPAKLTQFIEKWAFNVEGNQTLFLLPEKCNFLGSDSILLQSAVGFVG